MLYFFSSSMTISASGKSTPTCCSAMWSGRLYFQMLLWQTEHSRHRWCIYFVLWMLHYFYLFKICSYSQSPLCNNFLPSLAGCPKCWDTCAPTTIAITHMLTLNEDMPLIFSICVDPHASSCHLPSIDHYSGDI